MIVISDLPLGLVKYYLSNNDQGRQLIILHIDNLKDLTDVLLEGVSYNEEGELVLPLYLIKYTGSVFSKDFKQNRSNLTYLIIEDIKPYNNLLKSSNVSKLTLSVENYKDQIEFAKSIMEPSTYNTFWSEYCIKRFNSNPLKWYNEIKYLCFVYKEKGDKKLTIEDLEFIYNKTSDAALNYIKHMYDKNSLVYLNKIPQEELFLLFIKGENYKSPIHKNLELNNPNLLVSYMYFKEAFYKGLIRIQEGVLVLDYLIHNINCIDYKLIPTLFNLN